MMIVNIVCAVLLMVTQVHCTPNYVLVVPSVCRVGINCDVNVHLMSTLPATGQAVVKIQTGKEVMAESRMALSTVTKTATLQLVLHPNTTEGTGYDLTFSLTGAGFSYRNQTKIAVKSRSKGSFIMSDKAIYKPSQTVNFRVICIKPDSPKLTPCPSTCKVDVQLSDPKGNKIKQWEDQTLTSGVFTGKLELADQVLLGDWKIHVTLCDGSQIDKTFTVDEYVLPKFEVQVECDPYYMPGKFAILRCKVISKYTYGKGVVGTASVRLRVLNSLSLTNAPMDPKVFKNFDGSVDVNYTNGDLNALNGGSMLGSSQVILVEGEVMEQYTDLVEKGNTTVKVFTDKYKLEIMAPKVYRINSTLHFMVKMTNPDGSKLSKDKVWPPVTLSLSYRGALRWQTTTVELGTLEQNATRTDDGYLYALDTTGLDNTLTLKATTREIKAPVTKKVERFKSFSDENVLVTLTNQEIIKCNEKAMFKVKLSSKMDDLPFYYLAICRGILRPLSSTSGRFDSQGEAVVELNASEDMSPSCRLLVYVIIPSKDEVIADSVDFNVQCENNPVSVTFRASSADPTPLTRVKPRGNEIEACATAGPGSFIGMMSVDQSVLLLQGGDSNNLKQEQVTDLLGEFDTAEKDDNNGFMPCNGQFRCARSIMPWPIFGGGVNTAEVLKKAGVVVLTDGQIYSTSDDDDGYRGGGGPVFALDGAADNEAANEAVFDKAPSKSAGETAAVHVRQYFPEAWLWNGQFVGSNGQFCVRTTVPDTITTWITTAFAMSETDGLGLMPEPTKLTVYRPFFVSLTLLPSIKRKEEFLLKALVFNYKDKAVGAHVTLEKSDDFFVRYDEDNDIIKDAEPQSKSVRMAIRKATPGQASVASFLIVPQKLGLIKIKVKAEADDGTVDIVERELLVKPEGEEVCFAKTLLADLTAPGNNGETRAYDVGVPSTAVEGSGRITVSVTGDLMGATIQGLEKLLTVPMGCGEQNMLTMVPNIFVLNYLQAVGKDTAPIKERAKKNILDGYQRELKFKHKDGSFSAFGTTDPSGSQWLTAFVVKSFKQASDFTYIDDAIMIKATEWMITNQNRNGSFREPGRVIHTEMQGESAENEVTLTAFSVLPLLEITDVKGSSASLNLAVQFLDGQLDGLTDVYTISLVSYALHKANLADGQAARDRAFTKLNNLKKRNDTEGFIYWSKDKSTPNKEKQCKWCHQPKSSDIEITAYALMTYIWRKDGNIAKIGKWLAAQGNGEGGFSSTQDTVVGLQAMASLAEYMQSSSTALSVDFTYKDARGNVIGAADRMTLNADNKILLQSKEAPVNASRVEVKASGSGLAVASIKTCYYQTSNKSASVENTVTTEDVTSNSYTLNVCVRSSSDEPTSMGISEVSCLSGFDHDGGYLETIRKTANVKKVEVDSARGTMVVYYDEIPRTTRTCIVTKCQRTAVVVSPQPGDVITYSYYDQEQKATSFYLPNTYADAEMCAQCQECPGCEVVDTTTGTPTQAAVSQSYNLVAMVMALTFTIVAIVM